MKTRRHILMLTGLLALSSIFVISQPSIVPQASMTFSSSPDSVSSQVAYDVFDIYSRLDSVIDPIACSQAGRGYAELLRRRQIDKPILVLIDFGQSSDQERLFIIDMRDTSIVHRSLVAHGENSGGLWATTFSNVNGSHCSSRGFYQTAETYIGKHGLSLKLDGMETGINNNARSRAVVIHSADYVSESYLAENGRLGRSLGCPALPEDRYDAVIHTIKHGALVYVHSPLGDYHMVSDIIGSPVQEVVDKM